MSIIRVAELIRKRIFTHRIRRVTSSIGLKTYLGDIYYTFLYLVSGGSRTITVENASASFSITTKEEYFAHHQNEATERKYLNHFINCLQEGDVVYDVGANVGIYSCLAGDILKDGSVVAIEPHPENAARIQANAQNNHVDLTVVECALSDTQGTGNLSVRSTAPGEVNPRLSTGELQESDVHKNIEVDVTTGDMLTKQNELPPPTVIKIDVEGAEMNVIEGFEDVLQNHCRLLFCEVHRDRIRDFGSSYSKLQEKIEKLGFEYSEIDTRENVNGDGDVFIVAKKTII